MKPVGYVYHAESDCAFPVYSEEELHDCLSSGADQVSEYYCVMVELGMMDAIDHKWDSEQYVLASPF